MYFFFNDSATTEIYTYSHTLSLHVALPIWVSTTATGKTLDGSDPVSWAKAHKEFPKYQRLLAQPNGPRSEEHTSELQSLMRISYDVFCLKKKRMQNTMEDNNVTSITTVNPVSSLTIVNMKNTTTRTP